MSSHLSSRYKSKHSSSYKHERYSSDLHDSDSDTKQKSKHKTKKVNEDGRSSVSGSNVSVNNKNSGDVNPEKYSQVSRSVRLQRDTAYPSHSKQNLAYSDKQKRKERHPSSETESEANKKRLKKDDVGVSSDSETETQFFSFEHYKYELNRMFFGDHSIIRHGSKEHDDFWKFLRKYEVVHKKKGLSEKDYTALGKEDKSRTNRLGIPDKYSSQNNVCLRLTSCSLDDLLARMPPRDRDEGRVLSKRRILEFRHIVCLYVDFLQKEKFNKMKKLREAQLNLPVAHYRKEIVEAVKSGKVTIIAGDTGCGKSTQVPQYLLKAGFNNIACTQPRRIACISLCKRVSFETLNEYGTSVGYQIRFEKSKTQQTKIVFITEGLLLRQVSSDPTLSGYNVIVLDEVHERHLHGDFLLGILKCLLMKRTDLKVILMSATININLFQDYFGDEGVVIQVPGRLYPIKLQYRPIPVVDKVSKAERLNPAPYVQILQLIDEKYPVSERGDVLIFLSGMNEITSVVDAAKAYAQQNRRWIILPLHSTLSIAEQDKVG